MYITNESFIDTVNEHLNFINNEEVKRLYVYLIGKSALVKEFECIPKIADRKDYQFLSKRDGNLNYFAVLILKNKGLRVYFRSPSKHLYTKELLNKSFGERVSPYGNNEHVMDLDSTSDIDDFITFVIEVI